MQAQPTYLHRAKTQLDMDTDGAHTGFVRFLALSPDGKHALSGSDDKTCKLWDLASRKCMATW